MSSLPTTSAPGGFFDRSSTSQVFSVSRQRVGLLWKFFKFFPQITFYSYTKSINFLVGEDLPDNFVFTCSRGGKYDNLIPKSNTKSAKVFFSTEEAEALGLDIDHTDDLAISGSEDFALVIHGSQPAGSDASKALSANRKKGFTGYNATVKI